MKKYKNVVINKILISFTLIAIISAGCAKKTNENKADADEAGITEEYVYAPEFELFDISSNPLQGKSRGSFCEALVKENKVHTVIHYLNGSGTFAVMTDIDTGEYSTERINYVDSYYDAVNGFASYDRKNNILYLYDNYWKLAGSVELGSIVKDVTNNGLTFSCNDIVVDNEGNIAVAGGNVILLFDSEYNLLRNICVPNYIENVQDLMVTQSGSWYVSGSRGTNIYMLDMEHGEVGAELEVTYDIRSWGNKVPGIYEDGFYYCGHDYIYRYDEKTGGFETMFCPSDYGINADYNSAFYVDAEGVLYIGNKLDDDGTAISYEVARAEKRPASEVKKRTELVLGCISWANQQDRLPVLQFNKYNQDYYVTVKDYYSTSDDLDTARQNFYNDLITGKGADIFWISYGSSIIDVANLGKKGILLDLYELMDADEEVDRDDFVPNMLKQMEYEDGKLYAIYFQPMLNYFAGKSSVFDGYEQWNYRTLLDIMQDHPDSQLIVQLPRESVMHRFLWYSMGNFYNVETGECFFDSDEFKAMLQILSTIPENMDYAVLDSLPQMLDNEKVLMYYGSASSFPPKNIADYFGKNEVTYLGVPSSGGAAQIEFWMGIAINAQSPNIQAAWEFVKCYFDKEYQNGINLPITREYLEYEIKNDGKDMSEEQVQTVYYLIDNAVGKRYYNEDIYNIIEEEVQGYFAGAKSLDDTAANIQNRVQLYIDEKR